MNRMLIIKSVRGMFLTVSIYRAANWLATGSLLCRKSPRMVPKMKLNTIVAAAIYRVFSNPCPRKAMILTVKTF